MMICFMLAIIVFTAWRKSDRILAGRPGKASICKPVSAAMAMSLSLCMFGEQQNLSPTVYDNHLMVLNEWSFSGTEIPTWVFQFLLNPIFQKQFSIKVVGHLRAQDN